MNFQDILTIRAGRNARSELENHGLQPERVGAMAGAAGGPKWLILGALDRYLFGEWLAGRGVQPIELVGSSIGAWRFAAACHPSDPAAAIARLETAYLEQSYSSGADRNEISGTVRAILDCFLTDEVLEGILTHPRYRLHVITVRSRGLVRSETRPWLAAGSASAAVGNLFSRPSLRHFFERIVFSRNRGQVRWADDGLGCRTVGLTAANARDAVFASGNVPLLMRGVVDPPGAPRGIYRDGGIVDYHIDQPLLAADAAAPLVLMPHFDERLVPGWFDKSLRWRRARHVDQTLMIGPGPGLRAQLNAGRVPDRKDFHRFAARDDERLAAWRQALEAGKLMRDAFIEFAASNDPLRYVHAL